MESRMTTNICRACLAEHKLEDLCDWYLSVDDPNDVMTYQDCFQLCTQLDVKETASIHFLCKGCIQELLSSYRFIRKAQKNSHNLRFLSQKKDISCDFKSNDFELVIIQNRCKGKKLKTSKETEHTLSEEAVEGTEVTSADSGKLKLIKNDEESQQCNKILSQPVNERNEVSVSETASQRSEDSKNNLSFDDPEWDSAIKDDVGDISAPLKENVSCNEDELSKEIVCSVENNIYVWPKEEDLKSENHSQNSTAKKMRLRSTKGGKAEMEHKQTTGDNKTETFICDICSRPFSSLHYLHAHQQTHDSNRKRSFTCDECGRQFYTKKVYGAHMKTHSISREGQFKCSHCGKGFLHKNSLKLHLQLHIGPKIECEICNKSYVRQVDLEVHMRNHSGDLPFQCSKCEKAFKRKDVLKKHELLHSGAEMEDKQTTGDHKPKTFLCDICSRSFSNLHYLRAHQQTHDLNRKRSFTCEECGRQFYTKKVYGAHMKTHSSSREAHFKCIHCGKGFLHKNSLKLHVQQHIGPKFECKICNKRYVRQIDLEVHMRNHSGDLQFQCSKCDKAFVRKSVMKKHELLHTGARYKCDVCNKEYSHPSNLARHRLEHTGLPLKCAVCSKGFAEPHRIKRHIRNVHKVEDVDQINNHIISVSKTDKSSTNI